MSDSSPPRPSDLPPRIEIHGVSKSFDQSRTFAVADVSLDIAEGALVALVGNSGSGKTTLLKCINRLVEPDAGDIRIDGRSVRDAEPATLRRGIGYVFQGIGLFPHMRIAENIAITPKLLGWPADRIDARVAELLDLVDLPRDYARRFPHMLSGGQRQRVGVARAIAAQPRILLMDEPFGALDPVTRDELGTAYRALHDRLGMTTLMVTHDVQEAVLMADRIVVMKDGRVITDKAPRALMKGSADPDVAALMAVPKRQAERIGRLMAENGPAHA